MPARGVDQTDSLARLKRIQGQLAGVARMVESHRYCIDILQQMTAVRRALDEVGLQILQRHVRGCVVDAVKTKQEDAKISELMTAVERFIR